MWLINSIDVIDACVAEREEDTVTVGVYENNQPRFIVFGGGGAIIAPKEYEYELCALTEGVTTAIIQKLISENRISLQSLLSEFFTDIPPEKDFTVQALLTHTSGLRLPFALRTKLAAAAFKPSVNPTVNIDGAAAIELLRACKLNKTLGFSYCELNIALLGEIISAVCGKPFNAVLTEFANDTLKLYGFRCANGTGDLASAYWPRGENEAFIAANGAVSRITAALRFLVCALNKNEFIAPCMQKIDNIKTPQGHGVGLGWLITEKNIVWQSGTNAAFNAFWGVDFEHERAVCVLSNTRAHAGTSAAEAGLLYLHEKRRGHEYIFM